MAVTSLPAQAAIIRVDDDGPANFASVQAAVDAAKAGDIIQIAQGVYPELILLKSGITLRGSDRNTTILRYPKDRWPPAAILTLKDAKDIVIENLTIDGEGEARYGIFADHSTFTLRRCRVQNAMRRGIEALFSSIILTQNRIHDNNDGIRIIQSPGKCVIEGNIIQNNNGFSLVVDTVENLIVEDNLFLNNNIGLIVTKGKLTLSGNRFQENNWVCSLNDVSGLIENNHLLRNSSLNLRIRNSKLEIRDNIITENRGIGIQAMDSILSIVGNLIEDNSGSGIFLQYDSPVEVPIIIKENQLRKNRTGIEINGCQDLVLSNNQISENTRAGISISKTDNCQKVKILNNTISGNRRGIYSNASPILRGNLIADNTEAGVFITGLQSPDMGTLEELGRNSIHANGRAIIISERFAGRKVMAIGNYWGSNKGPNPKKDFLIMPTGIQIVYKPWLKDDQSLSSPYPVHLWGKRIITWGGLKRDGKESMFNSRRRLDSNR
jgi:parallel beta-helix repeat protein